MRVYVGFLRVAGMFGPTKKRAAVAGYDILLTGTFHSDNWLRAHLQPLGLSRGCHRLRVVSTRPIPPLTNVEVIEPSKRLSRIVGQVPARLMTFVWIAWRTRPDIVGGFHLLINGLVAALLGRCIGARALYFCVGGPAEVLNGGTASENRLFERLGYSDSIIERQLLRAVNAFDFVIAMGTRTVEYFRRQGITAPVYVVSGGIDPQRFTVIESPREVDVIFVGRLAPIKRVDIFLSMIQHLRRELPHVRALVVGDGALRPALEKQALLFGIGASVAFVGQHADVTPWLQQAKVFVLTSDSEGLPLSAMEAMMCGVPVVASHVGDLPDLVADNVNGYLIASRTPEAFAASVGELLRSSERHALMSMAALHAAQRYTLQTAVKKWDSILASSLNGAETACVA
ncbi:MAG: glycosyltransferase family 4 protein [Candidatus Binatia bacterium]